LNVPPTYRAVVPPEHPCLPGHFPGQPVVPAVVLLDHVASALAAALGRPVALRALPAAKFVGSLAPGEPFEIAIELPAGARVARFTCRAGARLLAHGSVALPA
jgi:3-hydroxymyristoyl/3-hydroxydecanoyl-(acyl carrier protein) dehydratase